MKKCHQYNEKRKTLHLRELMPVKIQFPFFSLPELLTSRFLIFAIGIFKE